jgi:hypothetical protein
MLKTLKVLLLLSLAGCNVVPPLDCLAGAERPGCHRDANGQYGYLYNSPITPPQQLTPEELNAQDDETCRSYGLAFGTPEYVQCRENISNQRQANLRAIIDAPPAPVYVAPPAPAQPNAPTVQIIQSPRPLQTNCYTSMGETHCTTQ